MFLPTKLFIKATCVRNETGLTLLEMLVSLTISAVLFAILAQFMFSGIQLWGKNDQAYQRQHRLNLVYQVVYNDLATVYVSNYLAEKAFKGDEYQLNFWREAPSGLVQVTYRYDRSSKQVFRTIGFWGSTPAEVSIFKNFNTWKFEYYQPNTKSWISEWDPDQKTAVPALIRITGKSDTDLGQIVIPIKTWYNNKDLNQ